MRTTGSRIAARQGPLVRDRSSAVVSALRARMPIRPEPVSSRTDSGSVPAPM
ncbi:Uncharacterised protein [Mycobacterium tuberculosis]|uniref:Uncharacterized protein n=1 Tax=Mycobacterium tuberculosis TaxID=1773 RepID=A0A916LDR5_MYCTX|nr:Uncharacterised protein [Mycobacterium tuberculosis]COZ43879.1 Uncharacterised protein [Mycobacterium tuberculosis]COZ72745.1 Uncharacterised protein [Mycobacterium tuberculosis]